MPLPRITSERHVTQEALDSTHPAGELFDVDSVVFEGEDYTLVETPESSHTYTYENTDRAIHRRLVVWPNSTREEN